MSEVAFRRQGDRRLELQHEVARALAEASALDDAIPRVLEATCRLLDWDVGAYRPIEPGAQELRCEYIHAGAGLDAFADATLKHPLRRGASLSGEIWSSGEPRWVPDVGALADFPQAREASGLGIHTGFGFPALVGSDVVGVLEFFSRDERQPDTELLDAVGSIGRQVGRFARRMHAERERAQLLFVEQHARTDAEAAAATLEKLERIAQIALEHRSLQGLLDALVSELVELVEADGAAILLVAETGGELVVRAAAGIVAFADLGERVPFGQGTAGRVALTRAPTVVTDLAFLAGLDGPALERPEIHESGLRSLVGIPLVVEDRILGVLQAGSLRPARFADDDVRLLELLADRIALAINQVALLDAEREARDRLRLVAAASAALASSLDLDATLKRVAEIAVTGFADLAAVDVFDGSTFRRMAVEVSRPELEGPIREGLLANPPSVDDVGGAADVLRSGEERITLEIEQPEAFLQQLTRGRPDALPHAVSLRPRSLLYLPLKARGRTLGVLGLVRTEQPFRERDVETARELAARAAVAVDNARLYSAAERGRERVGFLAEASAVLGSSLDYTDTLEQVAQLAVERVADWCVVHLSDASGRPRMMTVAHRDRARAASVYASGRALPLTEPGLPASVARVSAGGEPELWRAVPEEQLVGPMAEAGLRSVLIVPLTTRGRTLGALSLAWSETAAAYDEEDLGFAADLGRRAADAIDNARLFRATEEQAQAARVLESVGDGVFLVDSGGIVRSWNRAAAVATGLRAADVLDRPVAEAVSSWSDVVARIPIAEAGSASTRPESLPLGLGGRELWLSIHGVAVDDGIVYAFRDLTEDRALEEMRTDFVSTVSHELRTPLAAIYGAAMTLRRADVALNEEQRANLLAVVGNEADRLARTVNDILWASRLDSDRLHVSIESCDAAGLASEVVAAQHAHLPEAIELVLEPAAGLPPVAADADKVRQVLVNLVDNAVKYSPDGGRVAVRIASVGAQVRFSISDGGLGIPPAEQRRIFEKFYRIDPNMTRGIGGTGLGLYICRELLRRMNGRLWVESEPGRGSTFMFELPVAGSDSDFAAHLAR